MKSIAIIYHSRQGHTQSIAEQIQIGAAQVENIQIDLFTAESLMAHPDLITQYDGLIWGSPTYLGGVSGTFKQLMDLRTIMEKAKPKRKTRGRIYGFITSCWR